MFAYQICDTNNACTTAEVTLTIRPVNDRPIAEDDSAETSKGTAVSIEILVNDSDVDNAKIDLVAAIAMDPSNGSAVLNSDGNIVEYTPAIGFSGKDTFEYQLCDTAGLCDTAKVTVTVDPGPEERVSPALSKFRRLYIRTSLCR